MHIIITDGWLAKSRPLTLSGWGLSLALFMLCGLVAALSFGVFAFVSSGGVSSVNGVSKEQQAQQNIDAMAKRVGEIQAKLIEYEVLAERVAANAGVKIDSQSLKPAGSGGVLVFDRSFSSAELSGKLDELEWDIQKRGDQLLEAEARLFEQKLTKITTPSAQPVEGVNPGSRFGWRVDPFTGRQALHTGLDFAGPTGTPVLSAAGGVVVTVGVKGGYGNTVEIDHADGLLTRYAHLSKSLVKVGDIVKKGQHIAAVGSTGRSTGPHLHFEVLYEGVQVDPARFLSTSSSLASAAMR